MTLCLLPSCMALAAGMGIHGPGKVQGSQCTASIVDAMIQEVGKEFVFVKDELSVGYDTQ